MSTTIQPIIVETPTPRVTAQLKYYRSHRVACCAQKKLYYQQNKESIKAKRRIRYRLSRDEASELD